MNRLTHIACLIALPLALAACGKKEPEVDAKAEAAGEVLPGSIDDAMLPMDTVRSQPPLAPQTQAAAKVGTTKDSAEAVAEADAADEAASAADASVAPVVILPTATPSPAPATPPAKAP